MTPLRAKPASGVATLQRAEKNPAPVMRAE
jgi:hypothetical protein